MRSNPLRFISSQEPWLRGGIYGVLFCLALFIVYVILLAMMSKVYGGMLPQWVLFLPLATGHLFPLLSGFVVPYGFMCKFTEPICTSWSAAQAPGSVPWTMEGQAGYCITQTMTPTEACAHLSEVVGFWGLALGLLAIYFIIGAIVGVLLEKRRTRKLNA